MKNIKSSGRIAGLCVIALIAAMAVFSCGPTIDNGTPEPKNLSGTIEIYKGGVPVAEGDTVNTGTALTAEYSGTETVSYQWKLNGTNVSAELSGTSKTFTPGEPGVYTVTVSASAYKNKTSAPVTVTGSSLNVFDGDLYISDTAEGTTAITTAETGQTLYAKYTGSETSVAYQWFKGETNVTSSSTSAANRNYTPTESGSYTVKITKSNYLPKSSDPPVEVTGTTKITITFNMNGDGTTETKMISPGEQIGDLPADPERNGFTFIGWYSAQTGGTEVTEETIFNEVATVWARWQYVGGTPIENGEGNLVHENPLMEAGTGFNGTISTVDGTVSFTGGAFQYKFPDEVLNYTSTTDGYPYFIVQYELKSATGNVSGVQLRQYGNTTPYAGVPNAQPWLSNQTNFRFDVSGAGTTNGFSMNWGGQSGTAIEVRITNITFYKMPLHTVSFDLDGGNINGVTAPPASRTVFDGYSLGSLPVPVKEDHTLIGWKNGDGNTVASATPITGNWTLKAQWVEGVVDTSVTVTADENDTLFNAVGDYNAGTTAGAKYSYDGKKYWIIADARSSSWGSSPVAPFDAATAGAIETLQKSYGSIGGYTRIAIDLSTIAEDWQEFAKVTITYDAVYVGGTNFNVLFRDSATAVGGSPDIATEVLTNGANQTRTFDIANSPGAGKVSSGGIGIVKSATTSGFLLRITEVKLTKD